MLRITGTGTIGKDAVMRQVGEQVAINFPVAHKETWQDKNNQKQEKTTWIDCTYWRPAANTKIAQYLKKGVRVYFEGQPTSRPYTAKDGNAASALECRITTVELMTFPSDTQATPPPAQPVSQPEPPVDASDVDDLPF